MKWKLTVKHGYDKAVFIFDVLSACENFVRTFISCKLPDEPERDPIFEKAWTYVIEPVTDDGVEDDIPVK